MENDGKESEILMQDNKKGFTESANSVKPNDESFAEKNVYKRVL
ncbi:MAG: hypothetical protein ACLRIM_16240 [Clostridium sp.]|jgi:hypothetical protein|nr:hypothetical protein [[Clostridium] innocuum]